MKSSNPTPTSARTLAKGIVAGIDGLTDFLAQGLTWLPLLMALLMALVVLVRHAFGQGSIALQEAVMYAHGIALMLGISYTLKQDAHVRVDLFYNRFSAATKKRVNLCGHVLLLLPLCITIFVMSMPYVSASWRVLEGSPEVGGIPGIFLLKTLLPVTAVLVALQALAEILRLLFPEPESL